MYDLLQRVPIGVHTFGEPTQLLHGSVSQIQSFKTLSKRGRESWGYVQVPIWNIGADGGWNIQNDKMGSKRLNHIMIFWHQNNKNDHGNVLGNDDGDGFDDDTQLISTIKLYAKIPTNTCSFA